MTSLIDDMKSGTRKVEILVVRMSVASSHIHIPMSVTVLVCCGIVMCIHVMLKIYTERDAFIRKHASLCLPVAHGGLLKRESPLSGFE